MATTPATRFRQALTTDKPLAHLERLAQKLEDASGDLRNTDPSTRQTSLALAAQAGRRRVCEWLIFDEAHEEVEISRVRALR